MKQVFIVFFLFVLTSANASSILSKKIFSDTTEVFNKDILYKISDNNNYIYLNISTKDKKSIMSLIRFGFTVYFDSRGKQKKDVYVKYPYNGSEINSKSNFNEDKKSAVIDFNTMIEKLPHELEYGFFEDKEQFHKDLNTLDISLQWNYHKKNELLEFSLKIPKQKVLSKKDKDLSKLSIGFISNRPKQNFSKDKRGMSQGSSQMNKGGGRGSGMRVGGGMHSGGMKGNGHTSPGNNSKNQRGSLDYWFDAKLKN